MLYNDKTKSDDEKEFIDFLGDNFVDEKTKNKNEDCQIRDYNCKQYSKQKFNLKKVAITKKRGIKYKLLALFIAVGMIGAGITYYDIYNSPEEVVRRDQYDILNEIFESGYEKSIIVPDPCVSDPTNTAKMHYDLKGNAGGSEANPSWVIVIVSNQYYEITGGSEITDEEIFEYSVKKGYFEPDQFSFDNEMLVVNLNRTRYMFNHGFLDGETVVLPETEEYLYPEDNELSR
jgi:hypothetical protein